MLYQSIYITLRLLVPADNTRISFMGLVKSDIRRCNLCQLRRFKHDTSSSHNWHDNILRVSAIICKRLYYLSDRELDIYLFTGSHRLNEPYNQNALVNYQQQWKVTVCKKCKVTVCKKWKVTVCKKWKVKNFVP